MEILDDHIPTGELTITNEIKNYLIETAKWARFISILGFVFIGLIVIVALATGIIFSNSDMGLPIFGGLGGAFIPILYLLMAILYFFPVYYLFLFSTKMLSGLRSGKGLDISESFKNLKSHYKFVGILLIVGLAFYAIALLFAVIVGLGLSN